MPGWDYTYHDVRFTANVVLEEHGKTVARSMKHALRLVDQAYNALQVVPANGPNTANLAVNLEKEIKLPQIPVPPTVSIWTL